MSNLFVQFPRSGDVLTRHDGRETPEGLEVTVRGTWAGAGPVTVAGVPATVQGGAFTAPVLVKDRLTEISVVAGGERQGVAVLYDRDSFPRYRFSVDDVIWCFTEVAQNQDRYPSLFDHWFFAFFKSLHTSYRATVQMNIYYEHPEAGFNLTQFPDRYKGEWQDNADWLRLSFHARSNDCYGSRIYRDTTREQLREDYGKITEQIVRFAGESVLCRTYTTLHWAETNREGGRALREVGIRGLTGRFGHNDNGTLFTTHYYLDDETNSYLHDRNLWYDAELDLYFVNTPRFLNNVPLAYVAHHYQGLIDGRGGRTPFDVIDFLVHEEHFWKGFLGGRGYKPDNMERCQIAAMWANENGLKPVSFEHGIAGNG